MATAPCFALDLPGPLRSGQMSSCRRGHRARCAADYSTHVLLVAALQPNLRENVGGGAPQQRTPGVKSISLPPAISMGRPPRGYLRLGLPIAARWGALSSPTGRRATPPVGTGRSRREMRCSSYATFEQATGEPPRGFGIRGSDKPARVRGVTAPADPRFPTQATPNPSLRPEEPAILSTTQDGPGGKPDKLVLRHRHAAPNGSRSRSHRSGWHWLLL